MIFFQDMIFTLQRFWADNGCVLLQPYDSEVGAGTSHPATALQLLDRKKSNIVYVQPSRRPTDGRYAMNPNRMQHFYQLQVVMKPFPTNIKSMYLDSLRSIGMKVDENDVKFLEDNWKNPTIGAWGLGWEVQFNGMEISQFTYMQQIGGIDLNPIAVEITYGLERVAMYIQGASSLWDIKWNKEGVTYKDIFMDAEREQSSYNFDEADKEMLLRHISDHLDEGGRLLDKKTAISSLRSISEGKSSVQHHRSQKAYERR